MAAHDGDVVFAVQGDVAGKVGAGQQIDEEQLQPATDVLLDLGFRQGGQAVGGADVVDAGGDGVVAVGEGAVEVEHDGAGMAGCIVRSKSGDGRPRQCRERGGQRCRRSVERWAARGPRRERASCHNSAPWHDGHSP